MRRARLAQGAVDLIENGVLEEGGIEHLAARVGVTSRHLRRIFVTEFGVSPIEYAQTQRLLLAKRLLTDTALPVTEIARASGFASVRRFNALFKARYRMSPGRLRQARGAGALPAVLAFELAYRRRTRSTRCSISCASARSRVSKASRRSAAQVEPGVGVARALAVFEGVTSSASAGLPGDAAG